MTPAHKLRQHSWKIILPVAWVLMACGSFGPASPSLSEVEILATADSIRSRTPAVTQAEDGVARGGSYLDDLHADSIDTATSQAIDNIIATDHAWLTEEAAGEATGEAEWEATLDAHDATMEVLSATYIVEMTAEAAAPATATAEFEAQIATLTAEATQDGGAGCPGGCATYPTWCEPPIKGNVSFNSEERIYHMPGDDFYEETKIDPRYYERYFCTSEEAEAAGFRRAYN